MELRKCQFSLPGAPFYLQSGLNCSHENETSKSQKHRIFTVSLSVLQSHGLCGRLPMFRSEINSEKKMCDSKIETMHVFTPVEFVTNLSLRRNFYYLSFLEKP